MIEFQDAEGVIRSWLLDSGLVGDRAYFSLPEGTRTLPCVLMTRVGGVPRWDLDQARIQFDVFGSTKHEAASVAYRLAAMLENLKPARNSALTGAEVETLFPQGAPADPYRRYVLDATIGVRTANA